MSVSSAISLNPAVLGGGGGGGVTILLNTPAPQLVTITTGMYTSPNIYTVTNVPIGLVQFSVEVLFENSDTAPVDFNTIQLILNTTVTFPNLVYDIGTFSSGALFTVPSDATDQKIYTFTYYNTDVQDFTLRVFTDVTSGAFATSAPFFQTSNALMYKLA